MLIFKGLCPLCSGTGGYILYMSPIEESKMHCAVCNKQIFGNRPFCSDECEDKNLELINDQQAYVAPSGDDWYDTQYELFTQE